MPDKINILFVDDEKDVLFGLRGMLRSKRREWKMIFAESGQEALQILGENHIQAVVTDMRMPGMSGADLLQIVSKKYPGIVRIILSGQSDAETILRAVKPSHQYLAKPCEPEKLKSVLTRTSDQTSFPLNDLLKQMISKVSKIPTLPQLYTELLGVLNSDNVSIKEVGQVISKDIGMTAKVLHLVHSAYFGIPRPVENPMQAVTLLGLSNIKALVLSVKIFSMFKGDSKNILCLEKLTENSIKTGRYAKLIVGLETKNQKMANDAFLAGMLHNIGKLLLADKLSEQYAQSLSIAKDEALTDYQAEQKVFGATHAEVGAHLLGLWGIPHEIVEAIAFHYCPQKLAHNQFGIVTAVHIANVLAQGEQPQKNGVILNNVDEDYLKKINLIEKLPLWKAEVKTQL